MLFQRVRHLPQTRSGVARLSRVETVPLGPSCYRGEHPQELALLTETDTAHTFLIVTCCVPNTVARCSTETRPILILGQDVCH